MLDLLVNRSLHRYENGKSPSSPPSITNDFQNPTYYHVVIVIFVIVIFIIMIFVITVTIIIIRTQPTTVWGEEERWSKRKQAQQLTSLSTGWS